MAAERFSLFATCAPGVEPALHAELAALHFARVERQVGGVYFEGDELDVWRANLLLRTAIRVLRRVARFSARSEDELYAGAREVAWERFVRPDGTLAVTAHSSDSELFHTGFLAQLAKDAVVDRFRDATGMRPSVDKDDPDLGIRVQLVKDRCTLLVDTSGPSLHKRGWRRYQGRAPLAETFAAALPMLSGWDRRAPLVDPFCGSGTILVEAALYAAGRAPGAFRDSFAFERLPGHDAPRYAALREELCAPRPLPRKLRLIGSDSDPERVAGARENLAAAGFADEVSLEVRDARAVAWKPGWNAWIVTNPPYGERIGDARELAGLYTELGASLHRQARGYRLALLTGSAALADALRLDGLERLPIKNGALDCVLCLGEIGT
jgi:23S rRNA G2445 N2-methylase RlmL